MPRLHCRTHKSGGVSRPSLEVREGIAHCLDLDLRVAMAARKTKVREGIVHCFDLDLWVGDGCAADEAADAVEAMMPMLAGGS